MIGSEAQEEAQQEGAERAYARSNQQAPRQFDKVVLSTPNGRRWTN
jgi:hypothetical protein